MSVVMAEPGPYPHSAVKRVPRGMDPKTAEPTGIASPTAALGIRANDLKDVVVGHRETAAEAVRDFGGAIARALPLSSADRDVLARVLGVPSSLALRWVQDTVMVLRDPGPLLDTAEGLIVLAERLDIVAWAWGEVPEGWPPAHEDQIARTWASELAAPLKALVEAAESEA